MAAGTSNGQALPQSAAWPRPHRRPHWGGAGGGDGAAEAPPGSHGTQLCPQGQPSCRPQERLGQPAERLCQTLTCRGPTPAFQTRVRTGPWGEGWMRGHVVAHTRVCSHAGTGGPGERGGRVDTCSLTHVLTHTQAAGTRQQGGGTPACERGEAGLGLALRGFLSSAPGTSLGEQLPSPSHSDSLTGPHVTWRLSAPEERGQRGGDRQPCRRPALRAAVSRYLVFNDDTVSQRRTAPGLSGPY